MWYEIWSTLSPFAVWLCVLNWIDLIVVTWKMLAFTLHFFLLTGGDVRQTMLLMPPFSQALEANLRRASVLFWPHKPRIHSGRDHNATPRRVRWEDLWDLWSRQQGTHDRTGPVVVFFQCLLISKGCIQAAPVNKQHTSVTIHWIYCTYSPSLHPHQYSNFYFKLVTVATLSSGLACCCPFVLPPITVVLC